MASGLCHTFDDEREVDLENHDMQWWWGGGNGDGDWYGDSGGDGDGLLKLFCNNVDNIGVCIDCDEVDDIGDSDHLNSDDEERKVFFSWFHHLEAGGSRGLTQFPMLDSLSPQLNTSLHSQIIKWYICIAREIHCPMNSGLNSFWVD